MRKLWALLSLCPVLAFGGISYFIDGVESSGDPANEVVYYVDGVKLVTAAADEGNTNLAQFASTLFWYDIGDVKADRTNDASEVGSNHAYPTSDAWLPIGVVNGSIAAAASNAAWSVAGPNAEFASQLTSVTNFTMSVWFADGDHAANDHAIVYFARTNDATVTRFWIKAYYQFDMVQSLIDVDGTTQWASHVGVDFMDDKFDTFGMYTIVQDGTEPKHYWNGDRVANVVTNTATDLTASLDDIVNASSPADSFRIGRTASKNVDRFGDVILWDVALTQAEIADNFDYLKYQTLDRTNSGYGFGYPGMVETNSKQKIIHMADYYIGTRVADISPALNNSTGSGVTHAIITNGSYRTGVFEFDGVNDYVDIPTALTASDTEYTFMAWVKTDDVTTDQMLYAFNNGGLYSTIELNINTNGNVRFVSNSSNGGDVIQYYKGGVLTNDQWTHLALVAKESSYWEGYVNGVLVTSNSMAGSFASITTAGDYWGVRRDGTSDPLSGASDGFRVYNLALTSNQVFTIFTDEGVMYP